MIEVVAVVAVKVGGSMAMVVVTMVLAVGEEVGGCGGGGDCTGQGGGNRGGGCGDRGLDGGGGDW